MDHFYHFLLWPFKWTANKKKMAIKMDGTYPHHIWPYMAIYGDNVLLHYKLYTILVTIVYCYIIIYDVYYTIDSTNKTIIIILIYIIV